MKQVDVKPDSHKLILCCMLTEKKKFHLIDNTEHLW